MGLLKDVWVDKNNGEIIDAKTDNLIAHTVIDLQDEVAREHERIDALETDMGDVEAALDGIIAIQNSLMGVSE